MRRFNCLIYISFVFLHGCELCKEKTDQIPENETRDLRYTAAGENREEIFNPHCKCLLLMECIREKCSCDDGVILDLIDESGSLSNIWEKSNLTDYASQFLEGRRRYILIKVTKSPNPQIEPHKYESLLVNIEKLYPALADRLERLSKPSQTPTKGKGWLGAKKRMGGLAIFKAKSPKRNVAVKA